MQQRANPVPFPTRVGQVIAQGRKGASAGGKVSPADNRVNQIHRGACVSTGYQLGWNPLFAD